MNSAKPQRQIISRIPLKGMSPEEWGLVIQVELEKIWRDSMSPVDLRMLEDAGQSLDLVPPRLYVKLDSIILHQAQTLGWRITLSELVRFRMSQLEHQERGPDWFRDLGAAMAKSSRIFQREELPPVEDPDTWTVKRETVEELRRILKIIRTTIRPRETEKQVFAATVTDPAQSTWPHLSANLDRWMKFFEANPQILPSHVFAKRQNPGTLFDDFSAWCSGWQPEALRQATSKLKLKL